MKQSNAVHAKGSRAWWAIALTGAALTLAGCDNPDSRTAGEKVDAADRQDRTRRRPSQGQDRTDGQ